MACFREILTHAIWRITAAIFAALCLLSSVASGEDRPLVDTHIHYSHDAWPLYPPAEVISILRKAGVKKAFVSSSSDDGTQMLYLAAPDLVVPVLRPYRRRGELNSWMHDASVLDHVRQRLIDNIYFGIGEFHASGTDANTEVVQTLIDLAQFHNLFLHMHSDSEAVESAFKRDSEARILWAHAGFEPVQEIRRMMKTYPNLWADLSFRGELSRDGNVLPVWRALFLEFPDRFTYGTDTYTPSRWLDVTSETEDARQWLNDLPPALADKIAFGNAEALLE